MSMPYHKSLEHLRQNPFYQQASTTVSQALVRSREYGRKLHSMFGTNADSVDAPINLTRWFAALSLICISLITLTSASILSRYLSSQILLRDATVSMEFTDSIVHAQSTWIYFAKEDGQKSVRPLETLFNSIYQMPDVVRANVFARSGKVLWSSQKEMIGKSHGLNKELVKALSGHLAFKSGIIGRSTKEEHVHFGVGAAGLRFIETYIPIWDRPHNQVVGVVELYKLSRALENSVAAGRRLVWLTAIIGGSLLFVSLYWIVLRADRIMLAQQRRLVEARSLAMIGETATAVAHGIRNPLASIRASAELTLEDDLDGARESAEDIIREADRLDQWARDLLLFSHLENSASEPIDVNELLKGMVEEFSASLDRSHMRIELQLEDDLPAIEANSSPIVHALNNLFTNSMEAMSDGGRLTISSRFDASSKFVVIEVLDDGPGIKPGAANKIFQPFYSTTPNGTGLGLPLSRRIFEDFGGRLTITNNPGGGVRAVIRLPVRK